jgi:hypothetical protein
MVQGKQVRRTFLGGRFLPKALLKGAFAARFGMALLQRVVCMALFQP